MTARRNIISLIIFFLSLNCNGHENNLFDVSLFGENNDMPKDCIELNDKSIFIIGQHFQNNYYTQNNYKVASLIKLDQEGNLMWEKSFGYNKDDRFTEIVEKDGFLFIVGTTTNTDYLGRKIWLLKLNLNGEILKEVTLGECSNGINISLGKDNDVYILGMLGSQNKSRKFKNNAIYIANLDFSLNEKWNKTIEQEKGFQSVDGFYILDKNIYLIGKYLFNESYNYELFLKKLDKKGNEIENKDLLLLKSDPPLSCLYIDGQIIISTNNEIERNKINFYSVDLKSKIIKTHEVLLKKNVGVNNLIKSTNGYFVVVGYSWGQDHNFYFMKIDKNYKLITEENYGNKTSINELIKCLQLNDGSYITLGSSNLNARTSMSNKWRITKKL